MRAAVAARLARRPPKPEAAAAPMHREDDDGDEEVTDATFDERMRAKVPSLPNGSLLGTQADTGVSKISQAIC